MGDAPDTWRDQIDDEHEKVQRLVRWFFERYEDPVEHCPWDEGEYVYIHGGPYNAEDVLYEAFGFGDMPENHIARAVEFINDWGGPWASVPSDDPDDWPEDSDDEAVGDEEP